MKKFIVIFIAALVGVIAMSFTEKTNQDSYIEYNLSNYFGGTISTDNAIQIFKLLPRDMRNEIIVAYNWIAVDTRSEFMYNDVKVRHVNNDWYFDYKDNHIIAHNADLKYLNTVFKPLASE